MGPPAVADCWATCVGIPAGVGKASSGGDGTVGGGAAGVAGGGAIPQASVRTVGAPASAPASNRRRVSTLDVGRLPVALVVVPVEHQLRLAGPLAVRAGDPGEERLPLLPDRVVGIGPAVHQLLRLEP